MAITHKEQIFREFQTIPGVGKSISEDLWNLGFRSISELKNQNAEKMYEKSCVMEGVRIDRCLLYVFRCAIYFASHKNHDRELLKWWNWKDGK